MLIGMFLQQASSGSYAQLVARRSLAGVPVDGGGVVTLGQVTGVSRDAWSATGVDEVMVPRREDLTIAPAASCWDALEKLNRNGVGRLAVVQSGRLVGYLSIRDVAHLLTLGTAGGEGMGWRRAEPESRARLGRAA